MLELVDDVSGPIDLALLPEALELRTRAAASGYVPSARARTQTLKSLLQNREGARR